MNFNAYRIFAFDRDGNQLYLVEPDALPSTDDEMHFECDRARDALDYVARMMPAYSYDHDRDEFVPAFISRYELLVPGATWEHAEHHVPSGDHTFCTHARTARDRAACRRARGC